MRTQWVFALVMLLLLGRTIPTQAADLSDPKKTLQAWYDATIACDAAGIKACFVAANPKEEAFLSAISDQTAELLRARRETQKRFGKAGADYVDNDRLYHGLDKEHLDLGLAGTVTITGDDAVLVSKPDALQSKFIKEIKSTYKKVGGGWKMPVAAAFPMDNDMRDALKDVLSGAAARYRKIADALVAGKFSTLDQLKAFVEAEDAK